MIDKYLIKKLKENDESAFKELVHQHSYKLMTVAKVYTHSLHDAQDVLQDALIIIFEKVSSFKGDIPAAFYSWMKTIVINRALGINRKKFKSMETSLEDLKIDQPIDAQILSKLSQQEIMKLIYSLPIGYRQVFALFVLEGYSHNEIAEMLDIKPSTSRSQFVRAKGMLKRELEQLYKIAI